MTSKEGINFSIGAEGERTPLVSIVICCYNQGNYLREAIESALHQTHPRVEIIVIDDGSVDNTSAVGTSYPQLRYLRQQNRGLSSARNVGLSECTGHYVGFLDADDRLLPNAMSAGLAAIGALPDVAFVAGGYRFIGADGGDIPGGCSRKPDKVGYTDLLKFNLIQMHGAVLYKRETLVAAGGFNESLAASEDYDAYLRLSSRHAVGLHEEIVAECRKHSANMTSDYGRMLVATIFVLESQRATVASNPELKTALETGLRYYRETYGRALLRAAAKNLLHLAEWYRAGTKILLITRLAPRAFVSAITVFGHSFSRSDKGLGRSSSGN